MKKKKPYEPDELSLDDAHDYKQNKRTYDVKHIELFGNCINAI